VKDPDDGTGTMYSKLLPKDTSKPFIVGFPKLIYPNLSSPASAVVKVTMVESGESKSFTIFQNAPAQKTVNLFNVGLDWGGVSNNTNKPTFTYSATGWNGYYCAAWANSFSNPANFGNVQGAGGSTVQITTSRVGLASAEIGNFTSVWAAVQNSASIVHFTRPAESTGTDWNNANSYLWDWINGNGDYAGNEGVLVVNAEADAGESTTQFNSTHIPGMMGLSGGSANYDYRLNTVENRLMDYLTQTGPFGKQSNMDYTWITAGVTSYMNVSSVEAIPGAVPVFVGTSTQTWCSLMVDPKRRIVVKTDSEMFDTVGEMTTGFGKNLQAWIVNTAQYGTHFSDYFWDSPRYLTATPVPQQ
jgi:hypothetical protein